MGGQERLFIIAIIISIFVILGLAIVFSFMFFLYSFYKVKHIDYGYEDKALKKEYRNKIYHLNLKRRKENKSFLKCTEMIDKEEKTQRKLHIIMDVLSGVIITCLIGILAVGISYRANGDQFFINNDAYITILTGSMEEKHEDNDYLFENGLNDQITQYSLVGIEKIEKAEDIKLYDIIAYEHEDIMILHRVIEINIDEKDPSKLLFKLQGDSNIASLSYETALEFEDVIGRYNGFQNYGLGVFITYIKSEIGMIALCAAFVFLFLATLAEERIDKSYKKRLDYFCTIPHGDEKKSFIFYIDEDDKNKVIFDEVNVSEDLKESTFLLNQETIKEETKEVEEEVID